MWTVLIIALLALSATLAVLNYRRWQHFSREEQAWFKQMEAMRQEETRAVKQIQAEQEALFNSMIEGVLVLDEQGRIRMANRAFSELFSSTADLRGKKLMEAFRNHEVNELVQKLGAEKGGVIDYEMKLPGLEERWLQVNATGVANGDGGRRGTIVVFHDLTRIKELERTREEFVGNVSHELRTPLAMIKGYVETLLDGARQDPEVAERFLRIVERNAQRLDTLIQDLLAISELESGRVRLNLANVNVSGTVERVFADLKPRATARSIKLVNCLPDIAATADDNRLLQVLSNLVDNAIKYGRTSGTVAVGGRKIEGNKIEIFVQDDGPGIPAESLERVFERFYRVDKARSREQGGTGLGLSIVKHIVQNHGGAVWVKSELGKGTTFFFTLPVGVVTESKQNVVTQVPIEKQLAG